MTPYGNSGDAKAWPVSAFLVRAAVSWVDGAQTHTKSLSALRLVAPVKPRAN
ncbi:MAG: hypothetical protein WDN03_09615 [Rhizomicrobium sp.]